jgi:hypothetical protein
VISISVTLMSSLPYTSGLIALTNGSHQRDLLQRRGMPAICVALKSLQQRRVGSKFRARLQDLVTIVLHENAGYSHMHRDSRLRGYCKHTRGIPHV